MKRKNLIILGAFVVILITTYLLTSHPFTAQRPEYKDFAIKNTSSIDRIFLAKKNGPTMLIEKNEAGKWIIDGKYEAWDARIKLLLDETMAKLDVKGPVPDLIYNKVINNMAQKHVKAIFYSGEKPIKVVYVGDNTADELGTYMYIEGSDKPFIVHIPGFNGYLNSRFSLDLKEWRSRNIFSVTPDQIQELRVEYPDQLNQSFSILRHDGDSFRVMSFDIRPDTHIPQNRIISYLNLYRNLNMEAFSTLSEIKADSILKEKPICKLSIFFRSPARREILIYYMPPTKENLTDNQGRALTYDTERYFAFIDGDKIPVIIQHFVFGKVMIKPADFLPAGAADTN